eukprot:6212938-Pleurochrysis_carterae.AAC.2
MLAGLFPLPVFWRFWLGRGFWVVLWFPCALVFARQPEGLASCALLPAVRAAWERATIVPGNVIDGPCAMPMLSTARKLLPLLV